MPVHILTRKKRRGLRTPELKQKAALILHALGLETAELSILITGDVEIRDLNREYRKKDRPTDVLSFPQTDEGTPPGAAHLLGDVVISVETAARQAEENGVAFISELDRLLIHGVLHLAGYDHETSAVDAKKMRAKERALMKKIAL